MKVNDELELQVQECEEESCHCEDEGYYEYDCNDSGEQNCGCENDWCNDCCEDDCGNNDCNDNGCNHDCKCGCENECGCNNGCNPDETENCNMDAAGSDASWYEDNRRKNKPHKPCDTEADCRRCRALLRRIQTLEFALWEVTLFLDMNPCNECAKRYYCRVKKMLNECIYVYERKCGPLSSHGDNCMNTGWQWAQGPWPWEGRD